MGWKKGLLALGAVLCALVVLIAFMPARWVAPWLQSRLHGAQLLGVGGLVWDGHAEQLIAGDGTPLGRLQWRLSRRALIGQMRMSFRLDGAALDAAGTVSREGADLQWHDAHLTLRLDAWPQPLFTSWGSPRGELAVHVDRAQVRAGWPMTLAATAQWQHAAVRVGREDVDLGTLRAEASGSSGVIQASLHDDGTGPLSVSGTLQLSPLGWRFGADLQPRHPDPSLRRWLARFGPPDGQGAVHIQHGAGLGATPASGAR